MPELLKIIRKSISSIANEAIETAHYKERSFSRVLDKGNSQVGYEPRGEIGTYITVGTYVFKPEELSEINRKMSVIKQKSFPSNKDYAIMLHYFKLDSNTVQFDSEEKKIEVATLKPTLVLADYETNSNGNILYAIIRSNAITTVMLVKPYTGKENMTQKLKVDYVIKDFSNVETGKVR